MVGAVWCTIGLATLQGLLQLWHPILFKSPDSKVHGANTAVE